MSISASQHPPAIARFGNQAILYLEKMPVGTVNVKGFDTSWGFGDFVPSEAFAQYAPIFAAWSLLMHADDVGDRLSKAAAEELSAAEQRLDTLKAQLYFPLDEAWMNIAQLTIDGELLEFKIY